MCYARSVDIQSQGYVKLNDDARTRHDGDAQALDAAANDEEQRDSEAPLAASPPALEPLELDDVLELDDDELRVLLSTGC